MSFPHIFFSFFTLCLMQYLCYIRFAQDKYVVTPSLGEFFATIISLIAIWISEKKNSWPCIKDAIIFWSSLTAWNLWNDKCKQLFFSQYLTGPFIVDGNFLTQSYSANFNHSLTKGNSFAEEKLKLAACRQKNWRESLIQFFFILFSSLVQIVNNTLTRMRLFDRSNIFVHTEQT